MKLAIIGGGQLGYQLYQAAAGTDIMIIDTRDTLPDRFTRVTLGYSHEMKDAAKCDVVALAVPPSACQNILDTICPVLPDGCIVLNFPTKYLIPENMQQKYPTLHLVESKLLGSAVGLSIGLDHRVILGTDDKAVAEKIRTCLPGMKFSSGDYLAVPKINRLGMKAALAAAIELEKELQAQGYGEDFTKPAVGGLMAGSLVSYAAGTLGEFGLELVEELKESGC